jgi:hypothetical protein
LQGHVNVRDVTDPESDGVTVHAGIRKWQLLRIPHHPLKPLAACANKV